MRVGTHKATSKLPSNVGNIGIGIYCKLYVCFVFLSDDKGMFSLVFCGYLGAMREGEFGQAEYEHIASASHRVTPP